MTNVIYEVLEPGQYVRCYMENHQFSGFVKKFDENGVLVELRFHFDSGKKSQVWTKDDQGSTAYVPYRLAVIQIEHDKNRWY